MEKKILCSKCGQELDTTTVLDGLCPKCLMGAAGVMGDENTVKMGNDVDNTPDFSLEEIRKLFPNLEIIELLGRGGMGSVYKARQPSLDRLVALKVIHPRIAQSPEFVERFKREAKTLAKLNHPNIVTVHDFGTSGNVCHLIMEYIDGVNLRQAIRQMRLKPNEVLEIVMRICDALQFAHEEGVVHRDIKPENILLDLKNRVKIVDFGLAKLVDYKSEGLTQGFSLTEAGKIMGTPDYMAPEQRNQFKDVDQRADIYSLGVVFYEMLTGQLPIGRFMAPSKKVQMDVRIDEIVLRTLENEPEMRYQQASQVRKDVQTIVTNIGEKPAAPAEKNISFLTYVFCAISFAMLLFCGQLFIMGTKGSAAAYLTSFMSGIGPFILIFILLVFGIGIGFLRKEKTIPPQERAVAPGPGEIKTAPSMYQVAWGAVILVASFLPWGKISSTVGILFIGGYEHTYILNGWNGFISIFGQNIPNWIVVVMALAIMAITILRRYTKLQISPIYAILLSLYGTFHCGLIYSVLIQQSTSDIGLILSLGSFFALLIMAILEGLRCRCRSAILWSSAIIIMLVIMFCFILISVQPVIKNETPASTTVQHTTVQHRAGNSNPTPIFGKKNQHVPSDVKVEKLFGEDVARKRAEEVAKREREHAFTSAKPTADKNAVKNLTAERLALEQQKKAEVERLIADEVARKKHEEADKRKEEHAKFKDSRAAGARDVNTNEKDTTEAEDMNDDEPVKIAVPQGDAVKAARAALHDTFKDEFARKSAEDKLAFSKDLLEVAATEKDAVQKYALFVEAIGLATDAGNPDKAFAAVTKLCATFDAVSSKEKGIVLANFAKKASKPDDFKTLVDWYLTVVNETMEDSDPVAASDLLKDCESIAIKAEDKGLSNILSDETKEIAALAEKIKKLKLSAEKRIAQSTAEAKASGIKLRSRQGGEYLIVDLSSRKLRLTYSINPPSDLLTTDTYKTNKLVMRRVPAGEFMMGDTNNSHKVELTKDFYIGVFEVTQEQWEKVMKANPSNFKDVGKDAPVEMVSWEDCQNFMKELNDKKSSASAFRLPTEAEWEYACRGGKTSKGFKFSGSDTLDEVAWFKNNSGDKTHPVGKKKPNELGLYDMSGNVGEWCSDWLGDYPREPVKDPVGARSAGTNHTLRGGSWHVDAEYCSLALRNFRAPTIQYFSIGFRLVLSAQ